MGRFSLIPTHVNSVKGGLHIITGDRPMTETTSYTPNHIPLSHRWGYGLLGAAVMAYGSYGLWVDEIFLPGKRGRGMHFHGIDAWLLYGAILCLAANCLAVIVDHFDTRNNETNYRRFAKVTALLGYGLFGLAILHRIVVALQGG
jgi:hypothetical protein